MRIQARLRHRFVDIAGTACVLAALALLSPGVRMVRAADEPLMSTDPALAAAAARTAEQAEAIPAAATSTPPSAVAVAGSPAAPVTFPIVHVDDVENASRPGVSGIEIQPGVVVLNTRGFNYGPPPTALAPEALKQESAPR